MIVCAVFVVSCGKTRVVQPYENTIDVTSQEEKQQEVQIQQPEETVLTKEEIIDIYLSFVDTWAYKPEFPPMIGYAYCLLDLDFDGICELVRSENDGSGRFSYNEYYRINSDERTVEKVSAPEQEYGDGYDIYYRDIDVKLLVSASDNTPFYFCSNYVRVSADEYGIFYGKMYMKNGELLTQPLFGEYHIDSEGTHKYYIESQEGSAAVGEQQYDEARNRVFYDNYEATFSWNYIEGNEFDSADENEKRSLFEKCYNSFRFIPFVYD